MSGNSGGSELLRIIAFGPAVVLASYLAFRPPASVHRLLAAHVVVEVTATILCAALVAYGCRRVVQALLRLCGFR
jgi:hypothetical protein